MIVEAAGVRLSAPSVMPEGARAYVDRLRLCARLGFVHDGAMGDLAAVENWAFSRQHAARLRITATRPQRIAVLRELMRGWASSRS